MSDWIYWLVRDDAVRHRTPKELPGRSGSFWAAALLGLIATGLVWFALVSFASRVHNLASMLLALGVGTMFMRSVPGWLATRRVRKSRIHRAPCRVLFSVLGSCVSRRTRERVFAQIVRDVREEYYEALAEGSLAKARAIALRGHAELVEAFVRTFLGRILRLAIGDLLGAFRSRFGAD